MPTKKVKEQAIEVDLQSDSDATIEPNSDTEHDTEDISNLKVEPKQQKVKVVRAKTVRRKAKPEVEKIVYLLLIVCFINFDYCISTQLSF